MKTSNSYHLRNKVLYAVLLILLSLNSIAAQSRPGIPKGKIIDIVQCIENPSQTYAAFVPSNYSSDLKWPVVYFFEPMARGQLPVKKYADIAEKNGYILVGSNNSKNGPISEGRAAFDAMSKDVQQKLNIDPNRIYVSGFSGGGRFAQLLANETAAITGVIAVAGPRLDPNEEISTSYQYFGIVGTRDMNYIEHMEFNKALDKSNVKNVLLSYNGPHQWPPAAEYESSIKWFQVQWQLKNSTPENIDEYIDNELSKLVVKQNLRSSEKYLYLKSVQRSLLPAQINTLDKKIDELESDKNLMKSISKAEKSYQKELETYNEISKALQQLKICAYNKEIPLDSTEYPMEWWQLKIKNLKKLSDKGDEKGDAAARTLDVIRGQVFGVILKNDASNNLDHQLYLGEIQLMLYPEAISLLWSQSLLCAKKDEQNKALYYVKRAKRNDQGQLNELRIESEEYQQQFPFLFQD